MRQSAKSGIAQATNKPGDRSVGGVVVGIEKHVLPTVWNVEKYWKLPNTSSLNISKIKIELDKLIEASFTRDGQIAIGEIYDFLENNYGFAPCNLSAFLTGFLLKEYSGEPYRYNDSDDGHAPMTQDKLAEMLSNYIGKSPKPTYIVNMTPDEMAFYALTEKAWHIPANSCSSAGQASREISKYMRENLKLPVWCLEEVDHFGVYDVVKKYIELTQTTDTHKKAIEIGKIATMRPSLINDLPNLITSENCQKGMLEYLHTFEGGKVLELAKSIGAENTVLIDIRRLFSVKHSCLWEKETGEDEIRKLMAEYGIIKESNAILDTSAHSLGEAYKEWRERLMFIGISYEALRVRYPALVNTIDTLLKICKQADVLPDQLNALQKEFVAHRAEIRELLNNEKIIFAEIYDAYLEDLSSEDIYTVKANVGHGLFVLSKTDCNSKVKDAAEVYRKNQLKSQLNNLWKDKTGSKTPREWSRDHRIPVLCMVSSVEYDSAVKAFDTINSNRGSDAEIKFALEFLESTTLFESLSDPEKQESAFRDNIVGKPEILLRDIKRIKDSLDNLSVDVYDWRSNPSVQSKVQKLAEAEYNAGGSDKVCKIIDDMDDTQLRHYLKRLVRDNVTVGIEILSTGGLKKDD
jgi:hypothetical protein